MQVFKLYLKLLRKSIPTFAVYLGVFLVITIVSTMNTNKTNNTFFEGSKVKIAYINHDKDSLLLQGFKSYLGKSSEFVEISDTEEGKRDALFYREISYILTIPEGFTENLLSGKETKLEKRNVPDSIDAANVDIAVNNYFNTARLYLNSIKNISEKDLVLNVSHDLDTQVDVGIYSGKIEKADNNDKMLYYNYLVYALLSVLILGIGSIMTTFTNIDIRRRNLASPVPQISFQYQQILGNLAFAIICDVLLVVTGFVLTGQSLFDRTSWFYIGNVLAFTMAALSIAYLVGSLVKGKEATNGIANVVGLGMSFISGVFVPKELLGATVIQIAKFTPAYWFTSANEKIADLTQFTWASTQQIFINMLIQLGFALTIFAITIVLNKKKSTDAN